MLPGRPGLRYEFPARGDQPPIKLTWYDGDSIPKEIHGVKCGSGGSLFVGDKGMMRADYVSYRLLPEADFAGYTPPAPTIPDSLGHHAEWIVACKTGSPTTCNFDYGGALTETVLLGVAAYRAGQKIEWDPVALKAKGSASSDVELLAQRVSRRVGDIVGRLQALGYRLQVHAEQPEPLKLQALNFEPQPSDLSLRRSCPNPAPPALRHPPRFPARAIACSGAFWLNVCFRREGVKPAAGWSADSQQFTEGLWPVLQSSLKVFPSSNLWTTRVRRTACTRCCR